MFVDPEIAAILEQFPLDFAQLDDESLAMYRTALDSMPEGELSDRVERQDHVIPGAEGEPDVTVRVHRPKSEGDHRRALVWMHGGGLILGSYAMDDARFDRWCADLDLVAISVEYRLAPETPFPGPVHDCYSALAWAHDNAAQLGIDAGAIGVGGASAGGGLAAALALLARDRDEFPVAYQLLVYPMLDDRQQTPSSLWDAPVWPPAANTYAWNAYLGERKGTADVPPHAAAARALDLTGLPPALIAVGGADGFVDENVDYAQRLNAVGVPVDLHVYAGAPHGFDSMAPDTALSQRATAEIEDWLAAR